MRKDVSCRSITSIEICPNRVDWKICRLDRLGVKLVEILPSHCISEDIQIQGRFCSGRKSVGIIDKVKVSESGYLLFMFTVGAVPICKTVSISSARFLHLQRVRLQRQQCSPALLKSEVLNYIDATSYSPPVVSILRRMRSPRNTSSKPNE